MTIEIQKLSLQEAGELYGNSEDYRVVEITAFPGTFNPDLGDRIAVIKRNDNSGNCSKNDKLNSLT